VERLDYPRAGFVSTLVLEPEDALAIERRKPVDDADRVVAGLAGSAGVRVERLCSCQRPDSFEA
jgi:hypothetical protein